MLKHTPLDCVEFRSACSGAPDSVYETVEALYVEKCWLWHDDLPGGVERFAIAPGPGPRLWLWHAPAHLARAKLLRLLFYDVRFTTEYVVWLDQETAVEAGWWERLLPLLEQGIDYLGQPDWHEYRPSELDQQHGEGWYLGVPPERRDGKPGVTYMREGLVVVRSERLQEANFPALRATGRLDILLGAIAQQHGWSQQALPDGCVAAPVPELAAVAGSV